MILIPFCSAFASSSSSGCVWKIRRKYWQCFNCESWNTCFRIIVFCSGCEKKWKNEEKPEKLCLFSIFFSLFYLFSYAILWPPEYATEEKGKRGISSLSCCFSSSSSSFVFTFLWFIWCWPKRPFLSWIYIQAMVLLIALL